MRNSLFPALLVIVGGVLYHVAQKSIPRQASPQWVVIVAYGSGILCSLTAWLVDPLSRGGRPFEGLGHWSVYGIGVGAVLIEIGFMLTYRAGWDLGVASVMGNIAIALMLLPVGIFLFGERLTMRTVGGIICCLAGLILLSRR